MIQPMPTTSVIMTSMVVPDRAAFFNTTTPPMDSRMPTKTFSTRQPAGRPSSTMDETMRMTPETTK